MRIGYGMDMITKNLGTVLIVVVIAKAKQNTAPTAVRRWTEVLTMRLIDLDALGIGKCNPDVFDDKGYAKGWNSAIEILQNAPTVDAVPVVRCKDCIRRDPEDHKCDCGGMARQGCPFPVDDDYYCAYGERKGGDE